MTEFVEHSPVLNLAIKVTTGFIVLGLLFSFVRLIKGPSLPDRVVSVDLITVIAVAVAGILAISHQDPDFLDVAVALALVAFLATVAFAWYADHRTGQLDAGRRRRQPRKEQ